MSAHLATVAGNIIENAGGPHALKYGVTYNHILSVEVVLANGSTITLAADDDGPDLLGVLIGSEATLGIVTEATVALRPIPEVTHSLMGAFASARAAADTVAAVIASGVVPAAVEWLDRQGAGLQQFYDTGYPVDADAIVLIDVDGTAGEVADDQPIGRRCCANGPPRSVSPRMRSPGPRCGTAASAGSRDCAYEVRYIECAQPLFRSRRADQSVVRGALRWRLARQCVFRAGGLRI